MTHHVHAAIRLGGSQASCAPVDSEFNDREDQVWDIRLVGVRGLGTLG